jgi:hypothetical protein
MDYDKITALYELKKFIRYYIIEIGVLLSGTENSQASCSIDHCLSCSLLFYYLRNHMYDICSLCTDLHLHVFIYLHISMYVVIIFLFRVYIFVLSSSSFLHTSHYLTEILSFYIILWNVNHNLVDNEVKQ